MRASAFRRVILAIACKGVWIAVTNLVRATDYGDRSSVSQFSPRRNKMRHPARGATQALGTLRAAQEAGAMGRGSGKIRPPNQHVVIIQAIGDFACRAVRVVDKN